MLWKENWVYFGRDIPAIHLVATNKADDPATVVVRGSPHRLTGPDVVKGEFLREENVHESAGQTPGGLM